MGFLKASKQFSVPRTTLQRLVHLGIPAEEAVSRKLGRKPVMSSEMEAELVHYLLIMEQKFYGLTRNDVRRLAYQLCVRNGVNHPFTGGGVAGRAWFDHFINRHKDVLSILKPTASSFSRANGFNKDVVNEFFDILEAEYQKKKYAPDRIFNVDETGLSVVQSKVSKVVGLKGKRQVGALSAAERGPLVTIVCCMSAGGTFVPPMLIFPMKNMSDLLMKGAPPGSVGRCIGAEKPGDEDAACLFCEALFSKDAKGELWIQFLMCEMWAHNECAGCETDHYICDFCRS